jgi:hypothetical protein
MYSIHKPLVYNWVEGHEIACDIRRTSPHSLDVTNCWVGSIPSEKTTDSLRNCIIQELPDHGTGSNQISSFYKAHG